MLQALWPKNKATFLQRSCIMLACVGLACLPLLTKAEDTIAQHVIIDTAQDQYITDINYNLEQPFGGIATIQTLGQYIQLAYSFGVGVIGILATVLIMFAGLMWMSAAGNDQIISSAKEIMVSAVIGVVIALLSYNILSIINPNLLSLNLAVFKIPVTVFPTTPSTCTTDSPLIEQTSALTCKQYDDPTKTAPAYTADQLNQWITQYHGSVSLTFFKGIMATESGGDRTALLSRSSYFCVNAQSDVYEDVKQKDPAHTVVKHVLTQHACGITQMMPTTAITYSDCPGLSVCSKVSGDLITFDSKTGLMIPNSQANIAAYTNCCNALIASPKGGICAEGRYLDTNAKDSHVHGDPALLAASYNGGLGADYTSTKGICAGQIIYQCTANAGYAQTRDYVVKVLQYQNAMCLRNVGCTVASDGTSQNKAGNGYCQGSSKTSTTTHMLYSLANCPANGAAPSCAGTGGFTLSFIAKPCPGESVGGSSYYSFPSSYQPYGSTTNLFESPPTCNYHEGTASYLPTGGISK